jgi:hypothetical protein
MVADLEKVKTGKGCRDSNLNETELLKLDAAWLRLPAGLPAPTGQS